MTKKHPVILLEVTKIIGDFSRNLSFFKKSPGIFQNRLTSHPKIIDYFISLSRESSVSNDFEKSQGIFFKRKGDFLKNHW
eukprot:UN01096